MEDLVAKIVQKAFEVSTFDEWYYYNNPIQQSDDIQIQNKNITKIDEVTNDGIQIKDLNEDIVISNESIAKEELKKLKILEKNIRQMQKIAFTDNFRVKDLPFTPHKIQTELDSIDFTKLIGLESDKERLSIEIVDLMRYIYMHPSFKNAPIKLLMHLL